MERIPEKSIEKELERNDLYTLRAMRTPKGGKILAKLLLFVLFVLCVVLFLPWQQNIRGYGKLTALSPQNRPQTIETVIAGRIKEWLVAEGEFVNKGDTIVRITEVKEKYFDPQLLTRLKEQLAGKEHSLEAKRAKADALTRQVSVLREGMQLKIKQSKAKLEAERVRFQNAESQYQRNKRLYEAGNIPLTKFQDIEYKFQGSQADFQNAQIELDRVETEYLDKINKAQSDLSNTRAEAFDTEVEIAKLRNEYANTEIRNGQYSVLAPQTGYIVRAQKSGIGETIKEGDPICTIMPQTSDLAVEMFVKAMDVPLVGIGRQVRIQFDGWPALQFSGWPSVSVGTFGGEVRVIDFVNSKPGEFRILVVPDGDGWPGQLRMGSGTKGWVMLDDVPVWYELWRQLNGFPASLYEEPFTGESNEVKVEGKKEKEKEKK